MMWVRLNGDNGPSPTYESGINWPKSELPRGYRANDLYHWARRPIGGAAE